MIAEKGTKQHTHTLLGSVYLCSNSVPIVNEQHLSVVVLKTIERDQLAQVLLRFRRIRL